MDDDEALRAALSERLTAEGYHVVEADNSRDGRRIVAPTRPAVVVSGLPLTLPQNIIFMLTVMNAQPRPPLLLMAPGINRYAGDQHSARALGAVITMDKPPNLEELVRNVRKLHVLV